MKNIIFITSSLGFGGAAKMLTFVAHELQTRGHNVAIININTVSWSTGTYQTIDEKITVHEIKSNKQLDRIKKIVKIAKDFKADIIIGFTEYPNFYAKIVSKKLHIPSVMSERADPTRTKGQSLKGKISMFIINHSKGGVFQTEGAKNYYGKGLQKRGVVIPNPIFAKGDIPKVEFEDREKSVVSVGRFDNGQKRYDVMLKAFKLFHDKYPAYKLKLYGQGPDQEKISAWAEELGVAKSIIFMGVTKNAMQDISKDGMFIITSDFEGISNSLLEAMAVGLPCVSTDHTPGGARLLIQHGENGLLAPIGDAEKLADCLCRFAEDEKLAKKCGEKAREVLVRFAPNKIIDMWEDYINLLTR